MRSISRIVDVSISTVTKLLEDAGWACAEHHNRTVRGLKAKRVQCDVIWAFCYTKQKNVGMDGQGRARRGRRRVDVDGAGRR